MSFIVTFIAAVFVFSAVIAIHEFGHFMVAKLCGVQVNEFSIGMGPVLCKRVRKGTQYSIRALPVGGFVALEGEESPESQQAEAAEDGDEGGAEVSRHPHRDGSQHHRQHRPDQHDEPPDDRKRTAFFRCVHALTSPRSSSCFWALYRRL